MNSNEQPPNATQTTKAMSQFKKRTANDMSSDSSQSSCGNDSHEHLEHAETIKQSNNLFHHKNQDQNEDNNNFCHFIKQTFLGPVCTKCHRKVANGNILFDISRNSLKNHMTTNKCFQGDISLFKPKELETTLRRSMLEFHHSMFNNPTLASRLVTNKHNFVHATKNLPYCAECGFIGTKLCHVRSHVNSQSTVCNESDVKNADGSIMTNEYGFLIPNSVLDKIRCGQFTLHLKKGLHINNSSAAPLINNQIPTVSLPIEPRLQCRQINTNFCQSGVASVHQSHPSFLPSDEDIQMTISNNSPFNDAITLHSFAQSELSITFLSKEMADSAYDYLTSYALLLNQRSPGDLKNTLSDYVTMMRKSDNSNLAMLLVSGKRWLESGAANMDVRMVPVHHRNNLYLFGSIHHEIDKDLFKGGTFVWSDNIDPIVSQFTSLITFAYEIQWPKMNPFLSKIQDIYMMTLEDPSNIKEDESELASIKLVNTNIIFALLTEILLEQPSIPNGPNLVYKYLAGCTVRKDYSGRIILRNPNEISKNANALLRLFRHAICSMYIRQSQLMVMKKESHNSFEAWANNLIRQVQESLGIGHICRTIRTAREVDRKTPSLIKKAFNDRTGELFVGGHQIHKSTWSIAIPTAIHEWDKYLTSFFPNHSSTSNLPLHWIFDLDNEIILAGQDSYISIDGQINQIIPFNEYNPILLQ